MKKIFILICFLFFSTSTIASSISLKPVSLDQWQTELSTYKNKIVVVDMWATWCTSCIKRFPKMLTLFHQYKSQNVQFISLNLDDYEDTDSIIAAEKFLKHVKAEFPNYHINENLMTAFEKLNLIGIPAVVIYDINNKERYRLTGDNPYKQFTDQDIEKAIQQLIKEAKP